MLETYAKKIQAWWDTCVGSTLLKQRQADLKHTVQAAQPNG